MTYEEFRISTLKANTKKHRFKISGSYGTRDAYRWAIKNRLISKSISETKYRKIIKMLNLTLQERLLQGKTVKFPEKLGTLEVRKYKPYINLEGSKIKTNLAIDWKSTLKLWYEDEEAFYNKTLIRHEVDEKFKILYNKGKAVFNNKVFYTFTPTRDIKLKLKELINNQGVDALLINDENGLYRCKCNSRQNKKKSSS